MQIILASTSRYRREIVSRLGLAIDAIAPICDETPLPGESALATARRLARTKAESLIPAHPAALIIGSDQVALLDGTQIGKPRSLEHGVEMLTWMGGRCVVFHSALALVNSASGRVQTCEGISRVTLRPISERQAREYLRREPDALNCAGAAKSEGLGGALIERIESDDPNALIGVPLYGLVGLLQNEGVEIL
ncbi:Maf family protein [Paludibacterium yongneupense]|uniref:Maf family protein n=1 Tax=Paludibacterium yongneupense TaxID=400061 RepID=UPI000409DF59|nr:Maf family nucleotide pyrophosphatase [Paludibacterium yongneupense]